METHLCHCQKERNFLKIMTLDLRIIVTKYRKMMRKILKILTKYLKNNDVMS